ncbi:hypothetical protein M514_04353 [Trichuris suis]|uniref:Integrase catalytic domain-containing protein n=1 Tax=Trichuris suis TaxID=68888 RepID=A0A085NIV7_9BILA|nr:hypothetical protein M514_04353 [Trichuris suis]
MEYIAKMKNCFGRKPTAFLIDGGREYVGREMKKCFVGEGIDVQTTVPYILQQNRVAEHKNHSLIKIAKYMLLDARLRSRFWSEAVRSATHLQNQVPSRNVDKTPCEHFFGQKPDLGHT